MGCIQSSLSACRTVVKAVVSPMGPALGRCLDPVRTRRITVMTTNSHSVSPVAPEWNRRISAKGELRAGSRSSDGSSSCNSWHSPGLTRPPRRPPGCRIGARSPLRRSQRSARHRASSVSGRRSLRRPRAAGLHERRVRELHAEAELHDVRADLLAWLRADLEDALIGRDGRSSIRIGVAVYLLRRSGPRAAPADQQRTILAEHGAIGSRLAQRTTPTTSGSRVIAWTATITTS